MKRFFRPLLSGLVVTALLIMVMLKITMNFQILLFLGAALFFTAGLINPNTKNNYLISITSIVIPFLSLFVFVVLAELPQMWYFLPIYIGSAALGVFFYDHKLISASLSVLLTALMLFIAIQVIPADLHESLTKEMSDKLPEFTITEMSGQTIDSRSLAGKVIVLDFFGTWCKPCILELRELDKIQNLYSEDEVVFYIINADQGGDTPEKFEAFIDKNDYKFNYAYDHDSKIFKQLEMHHLGLPTLLIIDKDQNIRLQHVGYNVAETNFNRHIIEMIDSLK